MLIGIDGNEANISNRVGSNQYAFEVLKGLYGLTAKLENRKEIQFIVYLKSKLLSDLPKETDWWQYRVIGPKKFWTQFRLPLELFFGRIRPDVFFTPGHYAPRFLPMPLVVSIMDLGYLRFPDQFRKRDLYTLKKWTVRSIRRANRVLAISEFTRNDIIKTYRIEPEKVVTTQLGYNQEKFQILRSAQIEKLKKKYGIDGGYLLYLGTLKPSKNVEGMLEAFLQLKTQNSNVKTVTQNLKLVIAGKKGWMYEGIFEKVKKLGLVKEVVFTGFVEDKEVPVLMANAAAFVLVSFWEGFGISVLEAMAVGTPVVVSGVASLPEVIGKAGIVVDPNDADDIAKGIEKAFSEKEKRSRLGLEQAKKFSWEKCARKTFEVLSETAGALI